MLKLAVYFENAVLVSRIYATSYPGRRRYEKRIFIGLAGRLREFGNIHHDDAEVEENIINVVSD